MAHWGVTLCSITKLVENKWYISQNLLDSCKIEVSKSIVPVQ
jgi:hypothetical protein